MEISFGRKNTAVRKKTSTNKQKSLIATNTNVLTNDSTNDKNKTPISIDTIQTTFKYNNLDILCIKINECDFYVKAKEATEALCYSDTNQAIRLHVYDEDKKTLDELLKLNPVLNTGFEKMKGNEKNSIFINEAGLYDLILASKKKEAKDFKKFVTHTILPSIRKTGSYDVNQNVASSSNLVVAPKKTIKSFYDDHMITPFIGKNVLYIGTTGDIIEKDTIFANKYGLSSRVIDRDFKEHQKTFTNFNMLYIKECDNNDLVEKLFENELKAKNLWRSFKIKNSVQTELFITNEIYDIDYIIELMNTLIDNNPLKSIQDRDNIIKQLENNNEFNIQKMNFELKLKECDVKMKELDLKLKEEDNKNKQMEYDFKLKQNEFELQHKKIDSELQQKQIEFDKINVIKKMYAPH